jgi:hypothetical protein
MAAIDAIAFAVAAGFGFAVLVTVIVIIGIRQEERNWTLNSGRAPGLLAQLTRIVLGCEVRAPYDRRRSRREKATSGTSARR